MTAFLELINLSKTFGPAASDAQATAALDRITLTIDQGEFAVISGPSGSGKTTLLNLIGGLDQPSSGHILLQDRAINELTEKELSRLRRERIGFVFQSHNLLPALSASQNIAFVMRLQGWRSDAIRDRTRELAQRLDIATLLGQLPHQLSGGQQQRVAVARAVAVRPALLLADEPTASLDADNGKRLLDLLLELNETEHVTVIISSHDQRVIKRARRSIVLRDGRVELDSRAK